MRFEAPSILVGFTALSVEIKTISATLFFLQLSAILIVPKIFVNIPAYAGNINLNSKGSTILDLSKDRINVVRIEVPPISHRREDIIPICNHYLDHFNKNKN